MVLQNHVLISDTPVTSSCEPVLASDKPRCAPLKSGAPMAKRGNMARRRRDYVLLAVATRLSQTEVYIHKIYIYINEYVYKYIYIYV